MAAFLDEVQQIGADLSEAQVQRRLQDIGTRLYDLLLPEDMQASLWEHRDEIGDLIVYADEPYVPWELASQATQGSEAEEASVPGARRPGALASRQLPAEGDQIREVAPGRSSRTTVTRVSSCPNRSTSSATSRSTSGPARYVRHRQVFQLVARRPVRPAPLLGHGAAKVEDILGARILLQGRRRGGPWSNSSSRRPR